MLARAALSRLAADVPTTSTRNLSQLARSLRRSLLTRNALSLPATRAISRAYKAALVDARRSYATTTLAAKPTKTVKKAVKAKADGKAAPKKKKATTTKAKATPKKATKAAAKPKKKPAAKKAAPKTPAKKRVRKVLTPEEKQQAKIRELKKLALRAPFAQPTVQGRHIFISEALSGTKDTTKGIVDANAKWNNLTPAEIEHYNHLANEKTTAKKAEYQTWVESHTVDEIRIANNARTQLRKLLPSTKKGNHANTAKIQDDRQAKRRRNAYVFFFTERRATGDFKSIKTTDAATLIGAEWKALSDSEKSKYQEEADAYNRENIPAQA